jgi:O-antigen/teichoic acid export membrane protein
MFSALTIVVYMKVDQIMIGQMLGDSQVGTYAAAVRLIEIWYVVPGIIAVSVFPALTRAHASNPDNYFELLQDFFDLMVLIPTLLAILVSIFSSQLLLLTYGTEYIEARSTLLIYAWSSIPVFLLVATAQHLIITNSTRFAFLRNAGGMIINIGLNFALIPLWGIEGSAAASLMAYLSASMLANGLHPEMRKILIMEARALVLPLTLRRLYVTFRSIG